MDEEEALRLLTITRDKINRIDDEIIELIIERTSLAGDIASAKIVLGMDIHDPSREDYIRDKIRNIAKKENIDEVSLTEVMNLLTELNKREQRKIYRR